MLEVGLCVVHQHRPGLYRPLGSSAANAPSQRLPQFRHHHASRRTNIDLKLSVHAVHEHKNGADGQFKNGAFDPSDFSVASIDVSESQQQHHNGSDEQQAVRQTKRKRIEVPAARQNRSVLESMGYDEDDFVDALDDPFPNLPLGTIHPRAGWYEWWRRLTVVLVVFSAFMTPYRFAFRDDSPSVVAVDLFVDTLFLIDMYLNTRLAYVDEKENKLVTNPRDIVLRYVGRWDGFWVDAASTVSFDLLIKHVSGNVITLRRHLHTQASFADALGLLRLIRLKRLVQAFMALEKDPSIDYVAVSITKLLMLFFILSHWAACAFFYMARTHGFDGSTWVHAIDSSLPFKDRAEQYVTSLYWAVTTMTGVGYGDITPHNSDERLLSITVMVTNLALTAYILGTMTLIATKSDANTAEYRDQVGRLNSYLRVRGVSGPLLSEAMKAMSLQFDRAAAHADALQKLPQPMRHRLLEHMFFGTLARCYIFAGCSTPFLQALLAAGVREDFIEAGSEAVSRGQRAGTLYIILEGIAEVQDSGMALGWLTEGCAIAEESLLCGVTQSWCVVARSLVRVLALPKSTFADIGLEFPGDIRRCRRNVIAHARQRAKDGARYIAALLPQMETNVTAAAAEAALPLFHAARVGDVGAMSRLLSDDAASLLNASDYDGRTVLHIAALNNSVKVVELLLKQECVDVNKTDEFGNTAIMNAAMKGNDDIVVMLRSHGGTLGAADVADVLCSAAARSNVPRLQTFLAAGVDVNVRNCDGRTPLHVAAAEASLAAITLLLQHGADTRVQDRWGQTPLDEALIHRQFTAAKLLREHGGVASLKMRPHNAAGAHAIDD